MGTVVLDMSMSLDGFVTGPGPRVGLPLGGARAAAARLDVQRGRRRQQRGRPGVVRDDRDRFDGAADLVHTPNVAQQLLRAGLLDEIQLHLVPVLLGAGRRLFDHIGETGRELELTSVTEAPGVTHLRYRVAR